MVPSNWRILKLAELNGDVGVIEGDDSYLTDGFDIEANQQFPDENAAPFPSNHRIWVNMLTLPAKTNSMSQSKIPWNIPIYPMMARRKTTGLL
jgi:hypothetical protein